MGAQEGMVKKNLKVPDWNKQWECQLEIREAHIMEYNIGLYIAI